MRLKELKTQKEAIEMKKTAIILVVMVIIGLFFASSSMAGRVGKRQIHQHKRIHQGVKGKELTCRETGALIREQHKIQRTKKRSLSDGILTPKERGRLEIQQDKASRHIYRLKHNE
jgi:hypothetical protein